MAKLTKKTFPEVMQRMREASDDGLQAGVMVEGLTQALERLAANGGTADDVVRAVDEAIDGMDYGRMRGDLVPAPYFITVMEDNDSVPHKYQLDAATTEDAAREKAKTFLPATRPGRGGVTLYEGLPSDENPKRVGKLQRTDEGPAWLN